VQQVVNIGITEMFKLMPKTVKTQVRRLSVVRQRIPADWTGYTESTGTVSRKSATATTTFVAIGDPFPGPEMSLPVCLRYSFNWTRGRPRNRACACVARHDRSLRRVCIVRIHRCTTRTWSVLIIRFLGAACLCVTTTTAPLIKFGHVGLSCYFA